MINAAIALSLADARAPAAESVKNCAGVINCIFMAAGMCVTTHRRLLLVGLSREPPWVADFDLAVTDPETHSGACGQIKRELTIKGKWNLHQWHLLNPCFNAKSTRNGVREIGYIRKRDTDIDVSTKVLVS